MKKGAYKSHSSAPDPKGGVYYGNRKIQNELQKRSVLSFEGGSYEGITKRYQHPKYPYDYNRGHY